MINLGTLSEVNFSDADRFIAVNPIEDIVDRMWGVQCYDIRPIDLWYLVNNYYLYGEVLEEYALGIRLDHECRENKLLLLRWLETIKYSVLDQIYHDIECEFNSIMVIK